MDDEIRECNAVDAATWCTIVLGRLENAQVKGTRASQSLSPNVGKAYVANVIIVAAVDSEKPKAVGIIAKDVAVVDVDTLKGFAIGVTVITVRTYVDGVSHVGPENAVTDIYVLTSSPVPPTVVVEGNAVVAGAQEAVFYFHTPATHEIYAVAP